MGRRRAAGSGPAGSTMPGEDEQVLDALLSLGPNERPFLLLAPRHPERAPQVMQLAAERGFSVTRRTLLSQAAGCDVVVLDTVGELAGLYQLGDVAFVGGSLAPTGGHNPIEPARFGVRCSRGPTCATSQPSTGPSSMLERPASCTGGPNSRRLSPDGSRTRPPRGMPGMRAADS